MGIETTRYPQAQQPRFSGLLPARLRKIRRPRLWEEVAFIGLSYFLYSLIRNGVPTHELIARRRADSVLDLERWLHLDFELALNKATASIGWLSQISNYYYATMHFAVTIAVLVWLYLRRPLQYRSVRTVLYATNIVALIGFWLYPLAPPRMLSEQGYIDTIVVFHTWGSYASGDVAAASNQFAAMPSLHIGWALWCGITLVRLSTRTWLKVLGVLYPLATFLVIVATANHFVLDAVGGVGALACGFMIQWLLSGRPAYYEPAASPPVPSRVAVASA